MKSETIENLSKPAISEKSANVEKSLKKLPLVKLNAFFEAIAENVGKLYIPVANGDGKGADYKEWKEGLEYCSALNTNKSAKDFFFPQTENLFELKRNGKNIDVIDTRTEAEDFVIFGARSCDVQSFAILDKVFLSEPVDSFYKTRREHGIVISVACTNPAHTCFCEQLGIDATESGGDIQTWIVDDALYLEPLSLKGKTFFEKLANVVQDNAVQDNAVQDNAVQDNDDAGKVGTANVVQDNAVQFVDASDIRAIEEQKEQTKKALDELPLIFPDKSIFEEKNLLKIFNSTLWEELSEACIACGTCTFVCPTCQCYDIQDFDTGNGIKRFRCWDSCMYSDFTKMAHGNPRTSQLERFRQRFMHKLVYFPANNDGVLGCVGCGRCLQKCPISMNIVKVAKALAEEEL